MLRLIALIASIPVLACGGAQARGGDAQCAGGNVQCEGGDATATGGDPSVEVSPTVAATGSGSATAGGEGSTSEPADQE